MALLGSPSKPRILAVDDDPDVLKTLQRVVERRGYRVEAFTDARAALERFRQAPPDLVLTDLKMPRMDGIQLLFECKRIAPRVPVILLTAFATIETAVSAIQWGAFDYLKKPFETKKIYAVIEEALKPRRERK